MNKPVAHCRLRVDRRHYVVVNVWPNVKSMQGHSKDGGKEFVGYGTLAFFRSARLSVTPRFRIVNRNVGEINLVIGRYGVGIFAHELQHFIDFWSLVRGDKVGNVNREPSERVPYLVGDMTNQFWAWFYKTFDGRPRV